MYDSDDADRVYFREHLEVDFRLIFVEGCLSVATAGPAHEAEVISVSADSLVAADIMAGHLPQLRHVACRSTGYDNVDVAWAVDHSLISSGQRQTRHPA
jgi:lactate dehydrogenase-like 2-hydroxyacid dehydrogenase